MNYATNSCDPHEDRETRVISYSHEENGLVERANKEVMKHLRQFLCDAKLQYSDWFYVYTNGATYYKGTPD